MTETIRPTVRVERVVRVQYRLVWEFSAVRCDEDSDEPEAVPMRKTRYLLKRATAYRMAAVRLIFCKRDKLATGFDYDKGRLRGCKLCEAEPVRHGWAGPIPPEPCRYHGGEGWEKLVRRLARWLRWRDDRLAELGATK